MNKIDDILERLKGQQPEIDDPDALTDRIMDSLPDLEPSEEPQRSARVVSMRRRWMAAAASILLIIGMGTVLMKETGVSSQEPVASRDTHINAQPLPSHVGEGVGVGSEIPSPQTVAIADIDHAQEILTPPLAPPLHGRGAAALSSSDRSQGHRSASDRSQGNRSVSDGLQDNSLSRPLMPANDFHYAALVNTADSLTYQDPARMDEFITKLADFNKVEAVPMDCTLDNNDSLAVSTAYVFGDSQELDLFSRLLQAACWYDSKTPGYLLNFSHQQFFFTLKDLHKHEKYLWIAERLIGGRILLFSTHSPIGADVSSACYQNYREQLTHTNLSTLQF